MDTFIDIFKIALAIAALLFALWFFEKYLGITFASRGSARKDNQLSHGFNLLHINMYIEEQIADAIKTVKSKFRANTSDNVLEELEKKYGEWDSQPKAKQRMGG